MINALSFFRLGQLMQEFLPHILVNDTWTLRLIVAMNDRPRSVTVEHKLGEPLNVPPRPLEPMTPKLCAAFKGPVKKLQEEIIKLKLKSSHATVDRMLDDLERNDYDLKACADDVVELEGRLVDDLKYTTCFAVEGRSEELFQAKQLFGRAVADRFEAAAVDIEEAGKCLALDRATASVFHLMRVLEVGLQRLAKDLGIAKLEQNWQNLLDQVDSAVRGLPFKSDAEKEHRAQRAAAATHLRHVKDAWRNDVMHPRDVYTVEQARDVFDHTRALMTTLAGFL